MQRKPANRLGLNGPDEVKAHIWLKDSDWDAIINKRATAPYFPMKDNDNFDAVQANAADKWNEENQDLLKQNTLLLRKDSVQELFKGYHYDQDKLIEVSLPPRPETAKPLDAKRHRRAFSLKW